jgi:hypothetical protein
MSEGEVITLLVSFLIPFAFAGGGLIVSALLGQQFANHAVLYLLPGASACLAVLLLACTVGSKSFGGIIGATLICLVLWRARRVSNLAARGKLSRWLERFRASL